jgi:hypothetical protein
MLETTLAGHCLRAATLAQGDPFNNMGRSFRGQDARLKPSDALVGVLFLGMLAAVIWFLARLRGRRERGERQNSPQGLFHELCQAHGLDRSAKRLLEQLARGRRLGDPGVLFLDPGYFDLASADPALGAQAEALDGLRRKLFAGLEGAGQHGPAAPPPLSQDETAATNG